MIAVVAALEAELKSLRRKIIKVRKEPDSAFTRGRLGKGEILLVRSGVGREPTEKTCTLLFEKYMPNSILSTGFAGGLGEDLRSGEIIISSRILPVGLDGKEKLIGAPFVTNADTLLSAAKVLDEVQIKYHVGDTLTINQVASASEKKELLRNFSALAVDMESYFVAQTAAAHSVPVLAARVVLDEVGYDIPINSGLLSSGDRIYSQAAKALSYIATHPGRIAGLIGLARRADRTNKVIGKVVESISDTLI